jgi:hypothetical protein
MAVALKNARLFENPAIAERDRTAQRGAAIINSVQTALASKLDFRGIIDSVGNKLAEIFLENVGIGFLDKVNGLYRVHYLFENGRESGTSSFGLVIKDWFHISSRHVSRC